MDFPAAIASPTGEARAATGRILSEALEASDASEPQEAAASSGSAVPESYTVQEGDTLLSISRRIYGRDDQIGAICSLNGIEDSDHILAGQKLLLP